MSNLQLKLTIKGARNAEESQRAACAAWSLYSAPFAPDRVTVTDPETGEAWRLKRTRKRNIVATRVEVKS